MLTKQEKLTKLAKRYIEKIESILSENGAISISILSIFRMAHVECAFLLQKRGV
nr:MAG TPA: hypothetical protein [Caudoviricetes sp.]